MAAAFKVRFDKFEDHNGMLCVYETGSRVPFHIARVFAVTARAGDIRGDHAHRQCTQLLVCLSGEIDVTCDDGSTVTDYHLTSMDDGLLILPGVWAREKYVNEGALLMVLCDRVYEKDDYISDYNEFRIFIENKDR